MRERFEVLQEKHFLVHERAEKIRSIRSEYEGKIAALNVEMRALRLSSATMSAIDKYVESDEAPQRFCECCGEPLLRATVKNAQEVKEVTAYRIEEHCGDRHSVGAATWADVRRLTKSVCCWVCEREGEGRHSNQCTSSIQHALRMEGVLDPIVPKQGNGSEVESLSR